jgi:1,5-anhydro-D-fructose reductase (1,5-anhydro-D-mannitol-forming)
VLAAAASKKHMFVEKPLGIAGSSAYRMARAIEDAGVLFQTGYFQRGSAAHQFLKAHIEQGHLGKITRIRHSNCHSGSIGRWFDAGKGWFRDGWMWMTDLEQAGVGAFGDLGTHSLDILMWLAGDIESVAADVNTALGNYACDEYGEALIRFSSGVIGTLAAGWVDVQNPVSVVVSGTEGHATVINRQVFFKSTHVPGADGETPWQDLPAEQPHAFMLFLDALNGADVTLVSPREAAERSVVMEAMYRAAETRTWQSPEKLA